MLLWSHFVRLPGTRKARQQDNVGNKIAVNETNGSMTTGNTAGSKTTDDRLISDGTKANRQQDDRQQEQRDNQ